VIAEDALHGASFRRVVGDRARAVGVDVVDRLGLEAGILERARHRHRRALIGGVDHVGGVGAGGVTLAKVGVLGKFFFWFFAWNGVNNLWRLGGWIAIAILAAAVSVYLVLRSRREHA
jgi:hypothetical protein